MTLARTSRIIGVALAAVVLAAAVALSGGRSAVPGPATRAPLGMEGGEHEGVLPPGIVSIEDLMEAKQRPPSSARAASTPLDRAPISGARCPAPCLTDSFATMDNASDVSPADPAGAAGDSHVVAAVNISYGVFGLNGATQVGPAKLRKLFPNAPSFVFDPKVIYDQYNDTYVLVFLGFKGNDSWIFTVAIPDATATDQSTWCKRQFDGDRSNDGIAQLADYPGVGYDGERVYITTNQFGFSSGYFGAQILAIPTTGLYDCDRRLRMTAFGGKQTNTPDGGRSASIQPAASDGSTMPSAEYLASFDYSCRNSCKGNTLVLWRIKETAKGLALKKAAVDVGTAVVPLPGTQKGASGGNPINNAEYWWDTGDLRLTNAFYDVDLDRLYAAHAVDHNMGDTTYREATARWYEIDPAPTLSASTNPRSGYVGAPGLDMGWPAVATSTDGTLFMTVSGAGIPADEYLSAFATTIDTGTTTPNALIRTQPGTATFNWGSGWERWGDYNQINRDPNNAGMVYAFNQAATGVWDFTQFVDHLDNT